MNRVFRRQRPINLALLSLLIPVAASVAWAQEDTPPAAEPPALAAPAADGEKKPDAALLGLAGEGKYKMWIHHTGGAEEAVIAVRVTATDAAGKTVTRTGSGFVLRCDGFVVVPEALAPPNDGSFNAELSFVKRDGEELTAPLRPVGRPAFRSRRIPYVTLKVNGSHFPGLPILNPVNVRPDAPVRVTWAIPDVEKPGRVKILSRKATIGAKIAAKPSDIDRYALRLADDGKADAPQPIIGAVVTDDKGIAALGIVAEAPTAPGALTFATFAHLDYICGEVGLRPTLADVSGKSDEAAGGMKFIPGGPVRVPSGVLGEFYGRTYKTDVVCTPPFRIDALPVTIGDYRAYLRRFTAPRLPQSWDTPNEMTQDVRRADLPATGMIYDDAVAYAEAQGKRLPTAVEWLKASQGANYQWYAEHDALIAAIRDSVKSLYAQKKAHYEQEKRRTFKVKTERELAALDFFLVDTEEMRQLNREQSQVQTKYFRRNWLPGMNSPVGFYPEDMSAGGVRDVLTNAPEMVIKNYAFYLSGIAPKPFPSVGDPYLTILQILGRDGAANAPATETEFRRAIALQKDALAEIDAVFALFLCHDALWSWPANVYIEGSGNRPGMILFRPENHPGFRCAK